MAKNKTIYYDNENMHHLIQAEKDAWSQYGELAQEQYKNWMKYWDGTSGKKATSFQDPYRHCVYCAGRLRVYDEDKENNNLLLQCSECGKRMYQSDIESYTPEHQKELKAFYGEYYNHIPDSLYRTIPDSLILEHERKLLERRNATV